MVMDIERLRALAEAATPGPWGWRQGHAGKNSDLCKPVWIGEGVPGHPLNILKVTEDWPPRDPDADFIATADPTTVIALLDLLQDYQETLRSQVDQWRWIADHNPAGNQFDLGLTLRWCADELEDYLDDLKELEDPGRCRECHLIGDHKDGLLHREVTVMDAEELAQKLADHFHPPHRELRRKLRAHMLPAGERYEEVECRATPEWTPFTVFTAEDGYPSSRTLTYREIAQAVVEILGEQS